VTVFPDGERRGFDLQRLGIGPRELASVTSRLLPIWVADQRVVYDQLDRWSGDEALHLLITGMYGDAAILGADGPAAHGRALVEHVLNAAASATLPNPQPALSS
jgi:hypothetical protein